jgi:hypothetical protein
MAVLPWRTTEISERDAPRTQFGMSARLINARIAA